MLKKIKLKQYVFIFVFLIDSYIKNNNNNNVLIIFNV